MSVAPARPLPGVVIVVIGVLTALGPLSLDAYLPGLPALAVELGVGSAEVRLTLTACLVGVAAGQLLAGPVTDALGRRVPLIVGSAAYALASAACALAPSLSTLVALRLVQGLMLAVGVVAARAVVNDSATGPLAVRYFSQLATAAALAPVVAPLLGTAMLALGGWRAVFAALAVLGATLAAMIAATFQETLPPDRRHPLALSRTLRSFADLGRDRVFVVNVAIGVLGSAALFSYVAGSSFVVQAQFGAEPWQFALLFSINGLGIAALSQVNARVGAHWGTARMLRVAFSMQSAGALAALAIALWAPREPGTIPWLAVAFFFLVSPIGLINPSFMSRAMERSSGRAGTASAIIGAATFFTGGVITSLTGVGDPALTLGVVAGTAALTGLVVVLVVTTRERRRQREVAVADVPGGVGV